MNDVMKVLRDEECRQSEHLFSGSDVTIEITFRASRSQQVTGRLGKIAELDMKWISTE
jgi:hypothetical protein